MEYRSTFTSLFLALVFLAQNGIAQAENFVPDLNFNPQLNGELQTIALQSDGKILIGGDFTKVGSVTRNRIARLNADGTLDTTFDADASGTVFAIKIHPNGRIIVGGLFSTFNGQVGARGIVGLQQNGDLDVSFDVTTNSNGFSGAVRNIEFQSDGKIVISGFFDEVNGEERIRIAKLNTDGSLDPTFSPSVDDTIVVTKVLDDDKIMIGGFFENIGNTQRKFIARLNSDGTLDASFSPSPSNGVTAIAIDQEGNILIGGYFTRIGTTMQRFLARLSSTGVIDKEFTPKPNGIIRSIVFQDGGKIVIGGFFTSINSIGRNRIARLDKDGWLDTVFDPDVQGVQDIFTEVRPILNFLGNSLLIGGGFTSVSGGSLAGIALLKEEQTEDDLCFPVKAINNSVASVCL